jgi:hypothetical protein
MVNAQLITAAPTSPEVTQRKPQVTKPLKTSSKNNSMLLSLLTQEVKVVFASTTKPPQKVPTSMMKHQLRMMPVLKTQT